MKTCALLLAFLLLPFTVVGQEVRLTEREEKAEEWVRKYLEWVEEYENKASKTRRKVKLAPKAPEWLGVVCGEKESHTPPIMGACDLLKRITSPDPVATEIAQKMAAARTQGEKKTHTLLWEMMHADLVWTRSALSNKSEQVYGLIGAHFAIPVPGVRRVSLTIPPGFLLIKRPDGFGGREIAIGLPMAGGSFRLFDFRLFGQGMSAHANLARVWMTGGATGPATLTGGQWVDMGGASITWKKK